VPAARLFEAWQVRMKLILRLAIREILSQPKFSIFFVINLAFGMLGFFTLLLLKQSIQTAIETQSRAMLSADISISSRRPITREEDQKIKDVISLTDGTYDKDRRSEITEMFSMLASSNETKSTSLLVQVKSVDLQFPLFGSLALERFGLITSGVRPDSPQDYPPLWAYPEVMTQLNLKMGDVVSLGRQKFRVSDSITRDVGTAFRLLSLAPKIYIRSQDLPSTDLLKVGSTNTKTIFYLLKTAEVSEVERKLQAALSDPAIDVKSHRSASEQMNRLVSYLSDYLALAAVVGLCLSALGTAFLFRNYLSRRFKDIGIFTSLGLSRMKSSMIFVCVAFVLAMLALVLSSLFSVVLSPVLLKLVRDFTPFDLRMSFSLESFLLFFLFSILVVAFSCAPIILKIQDLRPSGLFREQDHATVASSLRAWILLPFLLFTIWVVAAWQSNSPKVGLLFVAGLLGSFALVFIFAKTFFSLLKRLPESKLFPVRLAVRNVSRMSPGVLESFLCLSLGCLLTNLIPQLQANIQAEMSQPAGTKLPSFFLFDIQQDQVEKLKSLVAQHQVKIETLSPLVRARLMAINDQETQRTNESNSLQSREEERESRSRNRGYNLSYRNSLNETEELVDGRPFRDNVGEKSIAEVSVEKDFAGRLGIQIGDKLSFDIQGVPVDGRVVNLRRVRWNSFQPNFFIIFQTGFLEEAPKTFLGSIPSLPEETRRALQSSLVSELPNVSMIDVQRAVQQILDLMTQMSWALLFMAVLCVLSGLVVLYSVANLQAYSRRWDYSMLKIMGAGLRDIRISVLVEYGALALLASVIGVTLSVAMSYLLSIYVFDGSFEWSAWSFVLSIGAVTGLSILVVVVASHSYLIEKPGRYLFNRDL
jgi:putative ABC transport system permease protein